MFGEIFNTEESDTFESSRLKQQLQREIFNKYLNTKYSEDDFTKLDVVKGFRNQCQDLAQIILKLTDNDFDWKDIIGKTHDETIEINFPLMNEFHNLLYVMFKKSDEFGNLNIKKLASFDTKRKKEIEPLQEGVLNFDLFETPKKFQDPFFDSIFCCNCNNISSVIPFLLISSSFNSFALLELPSAALLFSSL